MTMTRIRAAVCALLLATSVARCGQRPAVPREDFLQANINTAVNPGDDFFEYANGAWLRAHPIPASEAAWGIGNVVREELYVNLRKINEDAAKEKAPAAGSDSQKIADLWATATDETAVHAKGLSARLPEVMLWPFLSHRPIVPLEFGSL